MDAITQKASPCDVDRKAYEEVLAAFILPGCDDTPDQSDLAAASSFHVNSAAPDELEGVGPET